MAVDVVDPPQNQPEDQPATHPVEAGVDRLLASLAGPAQQLLSTLTGLGVEVLRSVAVDAYEQGQAAALKAAARRAAQDKAGRRVVDGGLPGTLVWCSHCGGEGLLHRPDDGQPPGPAPTPEGPDVDRLMFQRVQALMVEHPTAVQ